jgi:hypothetical protein
VCLAPGSRFIFVHQLVTDTLRTECRAARHHAGRSGCARGAELRVLNRDGVERVPCQTSGETFPVQES